jgi:prepilin-type processing-associated H-X9-DG protein
MMTTIGASGDTQPGFATSDHVHPSDWHQLGLDKAPQYAQSQMEINALGGTRTSFEARANYGFLDGHAATLAFREVYQGQFKNSFFPDFAH